jgi:FMN phosphatase YigB (HAD superfamily)
VDWNSEFNEFMCELGFPQLPNTDSEYSLAVRHGIDADFAHSLVREFNESSRIAKLKPFADSVEYVTKLADLGFKFIVVTSISDAPQAHYFRSRNLKNIFGNVFKEIHCIEMGASKANILSSNWLDTGYFWIEDHMRQAEAGHEAGLKTVLINHPYNSHYTTDLFPTVSYTSPWKEIYEMVCKEYNL